MRLRTALILLIAFGLGLPAKADHGRVPEQQVRFTGGDTGEYDLFGASLGVSGDTAVVGAPDHLTPAQVVTGAAYVFVGSGATWLEQAKLTASDGVDFDEFGQSVTVSGDTVAVGAPFDDTAAGIDAGSVYVFVRSGTTWSQQSKLTAVDAAANDSFGISVALSGDTLVIGSWLDQTSAGLEAGSAYVFVRSGTTWSQQAKLVASDAAPRDSFGLSVALSGDTALVGAFFDDTSAGIDAGSAYVFVRSGTTWSQQAKLTASDAADVDYFGSSVAVSGETALIGAPCGDTPVGACRGSAYAFVRSGTTWSQQAKLTAPDGEQGDYFGISVAVSGDTAVVGAFFDSTPAGEDAGSAYVFVRSGTTWSQQAKLTASAGRAFDHFGVSVALTEEAALVGAFFDDSREENAGAVYAFAFGCGEDGLRALRGTPAEGALSKTIEDSVEPIATMVGPEIADTVHHVNCDAVVPLEDAIDSAVPP